MAGGYLILFTSDCSICRVNSIMHSRDCQRCLESPLYIGFTEVTIIIHYSEDFRKAQGNMIYSNMLMSIN